LALIKTGDRVRIDLRKGTANILVSDDEIAKRRAALQGNGGYQAAIAHHAIPPVRKRGRPAGAARAPAKSPPVPR